MKHTHRTLAFLLATVVALSGCSSDTTSTPASTSTSTSSTSTPTQEPEAVTTDETVRFKYPDHMVETYGEGLEFETMPENIIILSDAALIMASQYDITPIAHSGLTTAYDFPASYDELPLITAGMTELDIEAIISMDPDLLIIGTHFYANYHELLDSADIPTFYIQAGPSIVYELIKAETICLAGAFGGQEGYDRVVSEFEAVEKACADFTATNDNIRTMTLFTTGYHQTSKGYLGSMLSMLPIECVSDSMEGGDVAATITMDFEQLVVNPAELYFAFSPSYGDALDTQAYFEEQFAENPSVWGEIEPINNGQIIYLTNEYAQAKGILVIDSLYQLMEFIEPFYA